MKNKRLLFRWVICFLLLNIYANGVPQYIGRYPDSLLAQLFMNNPVYWIGFWLSFFVLTFLVAKYILKLRGLQSLGMQFQQKWFTDVAVGFLIGFICWSIKNIIFYTTGRFEVSGVVDSSAVFNILVLGFLVSVFPAAINDVLNRGYVYAGLQKADLMKWFIVITSLLYALDDTWNEGFSVTNTIFSLVLGISLAYTVVRTGAIWMCIGIHTGSNFVFRMMYGIDGQGIFKLENVTDGALYEYINILMAALIFPVVYQLLKSRSGSRTPLQQQPQMPAPKAA